MLRDTIHRVPDDYLSLGTKRSTYTYNGFDLQIETVKQARPDTTNARAKDLVALNLEANMRKSMKGLGPGQYLKPAELSKVNHGQIVVTADIQGRAFRVPMTVTNGGVYSSDNSRATQTNLRDAVKHVMDGLFIYCGVENEARMNERMSARSQPAFQPAYQQPSMRM